jgi:hypothetical protein
MSNIRHIQCSADSICEKGGKNDEEHRAAPDKLAFLAVHPMDRLEYL